MATEKRLIDKQEAIKHLRGNCVGKYPSTFYVGIFAAAAEIEKLLEVDSVEVVRCRDCRYWRDGVDGCTDHVKCCAVGLYMIDEQGYCSNGKRKENQ